MAKAKVNQANQSPDERELNLDAVAIVQRHYRQIEREKSLRKAKQRRFIKTVLFNIFGFLGFLAFVIGIPALLELYIFPALGL